MEPAAWSGQRWHPAPGGLPPRRPQSEVERLQLQSRVWEPAGRRLLTELDAALSDTPDRTALDVGCGALVGSASSTTGSALRACHRHRHRPADAHPRPPVAETERLGHVSVVEDDLFATALPEQAADLVHARFQLAPLGRSADQLATFVRLARPGGVVVVEDPDTASWHYTPDAPRTQQLIGLILAAFRAGGGDFDAGRHTAGLMREHRS